MLDGVVEQLEKCQEEGIEAWDVVHQDEVLVIPAVLAFLGDNPMQSEIACHMGMGAKMFCRVCWVAGREGGHDEDGNEGSGKTHHTHAQDIESALDDLDLRSNASGGSDGGSQRSQEGQSGTSRPARGETLEDMVGRMRRFMTKHRPRNKEESQVHLRDILGLASTPGGKTAAGKLKTQLGLKDTFLEHFMAKLYKATKGKHGKAAEVALRKEVDQIPLKRFNPVWRIKGLDPHSDTPVEILHVLLLGCFKYFWRDIINRLSDDKKLVLIARLASLETSGLGISRLAGRTLVQYCRSLTGGDFRAISQAGPFILHDLGLPDECVDSFMALAALAPLVWQPEIEDVDKHLATLDSAIRHFLSLTVKWTPRWFNKPKFHLLLHLVDHIRDFGPACLFATEAFESFNAVIRIKSVHSNRLAPSRDIALAFAQGNRLRHLISGGEFLVEEDQAFDITMEEKRLQRLVQQDSPNDKELPVMKTYVVRSYGAGPRTIAQTDIVAHYVGFYSTGTSDKAGSCKVDPRSKPRLWPKTLTGGKRQFPEGLTGSYDLSETRFRTCTSVTLLNNDKCSVGNWVLISQPGAENGGQVVGKIFEILQAEGSISADRGQPDFVSVQLAEISGISMTQYMPLLRLTGTIGIVMLKNINCSANVQHNCAACKCDLSGRKQVRQERELTAHTHAQVYHKNPPNALIAPYILNTAKMRDAIHVQKFRCAPPQINEELAIHHGASAELLRAKKKLAEAKSQAKVTQSASPALGGTSGASGSGNQPLRVQQLTRKTR